MLIFDVCCVLCLGMTIQVEHLWEEKLTEQALPEIKEMVCPGDARGKLSGTRCSAQMKPPLKRVSFTSKKINRPSTAPLAPLRSSHRIGPVGTLGSVDHRRGENRYVTSDVTSVNALISQ